MACRIFSDLKEGHWECSCYILRKKISCLYLLFIGRLLLVTGIMKNLFLIVFFPMTIVHFFYWPWNNKPTSKRADNFIYSVCKKIKVFWNALFPVSSLILKMCLSGALPCIFLQVYRMMSLWSFPEISSYFCPEFYSIILLFLCICFPHCFMLLEDKSTLFFTLTFPQHLSLHLICQSWILTCSQISRTPVMIS